MVIWIQKVTSQKVFNSESAFLYCRRSTIIFLQYKNEGQAFGGRHMYAIEKRPSARAIIVYS